MPDLDACGHDARPVRHRPARRASTPGIDSSVGLMAAATDAGEPVWVCEPEDLALVAGRLVARARRICVRPRVPRGDHRWLVDIPWFDEIEHGWSTWPTRCSVALLRLDPPVDPRYLRTTYLLDAAADAGVHVVNRPSGVRTMQEKLWVLRFPDLCPETLVAAEVERVLGFLERTVPPCSSRSTGSPASTSGCCAADDRNARSLVESATARGTRHVIVQEYLPSVDTGNKRLFVLDGEIVGTVDRVPSYDDFRIGPPVGGRSSRTSATGDLVATARAAPAAARHRPRRPRRHRRPPDRGQRHLPRRHAQDRRPARHRPQRRDHAPPAHTTPPPPKKGSSHEHAPDRLRRTARRSCSSSSAPT